MSIARSLLLRASRSPFLSERVMRSSIARRAIRRFMPGEELADALDAAQQLAREGLGTVLTKLGENLTSLAEADAVRDHYLEVFDQVRARSLPSVVSVKPTQLGLDHSAEACARHLDVLATRADAIGSTLWIDMEDSSYVDRTLALYRGVRTRHERVGLALQAYLHRTPADLESLIPLRPIIRLVKGAYAEPPSVAFPAKGDTDAAYYRLAGRLLDASSRGEALPIFGTHDMGLVRRIVARAAELKVPEGGYEIHMLYGIRSADQRALAQEGHKVATLISYGSAWFPWYMRRLAERPANLWFVVRSTLGG
jgi:proline dehydrogenase